MRELYYQLKYFFFFIALTVIPISVLAQNNASESVLNRGTWFKIAVVEDGIYKLDFDALASMGIDMLTLNPDKIRIFGNEAGLLPELCSESRYDDLTEMSIYVNGADDGSFDAEDFVLFYGQETMTWSLGTSKNVRDSIRVTDDDKMESFYYSNQRNPYSDTTFYFLSVDSGINGLRIQEKESGSMASLSDTLTEFLDYRLHETDLINPFESGRDWYGEMMTSTYPIFEVPFTLPNLVKTEPITTTVKLCGRCTEPLFCNVKANGNPVVENLRINKNSAYVYGVESTVSKAMYSNSDDYKISIELKPNPSAPSLYLDYIQLNFWRQLKYAGGMMHFRIIPSQMQSGMVAVKVGDVPQGYFLWNVTSPLTPFEQMIVRQDDAILFAPSEVSEERYILFSEADALDICSARRIPNQNLHAVEDADMLIIAPPVFMSQAQELADFHAQNDALNCLVVNIDEIYNEFSSGSCDVTGIRDFIRMVYSRSIHNLKYVLLFGKASFDYRNIKGFGNNFVPCYEFSRMVYHQVNSICSDDYFGLMDALDGAECKGYVDLGVGRFPVATVEQAQTAVEKVRHYADKSSTGGHWKNTHLFFADDGLVTYAQQTEICSKIIDTVCHNMTMNKLYIDSYQRVSTTSGYTFPEANKDLMDTFEEGVLVATYAGHGGVKGLTAEQVFTISDVMSMKNKDRLVFMHTATCEFSKFDDPANISAGEQMFFKDGGGAIALLTTTRPTMGSNNFPFSKSFSVHVYNSTRAESKRFGDIVRETKSDRKYYNSANVGYVLFGDPALRLAYPDEDVVTTKINGSSSSLMQTIHALDLLTVEGEIRDRGGDIDTAFNGYLYPRFFDKQTKFTTLGNATFETLDYSFFKDVLYDGKVTVEKGRFSFTFQVPYDINYAYGEPRMSYYAFDSIHNIDANGVFENLSLGGINESVALDGVGPEIKLYWDAPSFENGDTVGREGVLYAEFFDEQGICHYDFKIGRDIVLTSNVQNLASVVMNQYFEPELDDFTRGRVAFPISNLEPGTYEFNLKAWDTQNNSSEAKMWFVVTDRTALANVSNYPNPFSGETHFVFTHQLDDATVDVTIEVFDMMGSKVANIVTKAISTGEGVEPIAWDGKGFGGELLSSGVYVYKITVNDKSGNPHSACQQLIFVR